jgi:hypothetical protein
LDLLKFPEGREFVRSQYEPILIRTHDSPLLGTLWSAHQDYQGGM